jgi:hypothetical protein
MTRKMLILSVLLCAGMVLAACGGGADIPEPITIVKTVEVPVESGGPAVKILELDLWQSSGHADSSAEAFRHWDQSDPVEVPKECAKCHSEYGYLDYLGEDGTQFGVVDRTASVHSVITCYTCHNQAAEQLTSVTMPSGMELENLGSDARCINCHQGRESKFSVAAAIAESGVEEDVVSETLTFLNIHYFAAAATKYGTAAKGGYEYDGMLYDSYFVHIEGYQGCADCHNPHSLELKVEECTACHPEVESAEDLHDVRMPGSLVDYDGDGDLSEGLYYELAGLQETLLTGIQAYAAEIPGVHLVYEAATYPYFFVDTNNDGVAQADETDIGNRFAAWTPRLLKAAYNYQLSIKDPGAFAHGGKYVIQLLLDSTADLNRALRVPVVLAGTQRIDRGHFAGSEEAFRHWDESDPARVPADCSLCHSDVGLPFMLQEGVAISQAPSNGFLCTTCHDDTQSWTRYNVESVTFPSGLTVNSGDPDMNLCMTCHQGRESGADLRAALEGLTPDAPSSKLNFINIHYFPAGATIYGNESGAGFEYPGMAYVGHFTHAEPLVGYDSCAECHNAHTLSVEYRRCTSCHSEVQDYEDLYEIRKTTAGTDFDGDGDAIEGLAGEIETMREKLYAAIQAYAADRLSAAIVYDANSYPYFFADSNGNGQADSFETASSNRYQSWSPRLLQAAYNYQYATKDPGAFAHNGQYILQLMYDSIVDLGGRVEGAVRP